MRRLALAAPLAPALGLLPTGAGALDAHALLAWTTLAALPIGVALGAVGARRVAALGAAVAWALALAACFALGPRAWPAAGALGCVWVGGVWGGLALVGHGLGARAPERAAATAALAALALAALAGLPSRAGLSDAGVAERRPALGAALLDASPLTLASEACGLDWMRHPGVYGPAGTDWYSGSRRPYRGSLAGPLAVVGGWLLAVALARRRRTPAGA